MSKPETVWIKYSVADSPSWLSVPSVGLSMAATVEFIDGHWVLTARDTGGYLFARSENRQIAVLKLIAARLGLSLGEGK